MKMRTAAIVALPAILLMCSMSSCQKEVCDFDTIPSTTKYTVPGGWLGKFGRGSDAPTLHFAAHFKNDGQVTVEADEPINILLGNWQLAGDSVRATYTYPFGDSFKFSAKYSDTSRRMNGYWEAIPPATGSGSFYLDKF